MRQRLPQVDEDRSGNQAERDKNGIGFTVGGKYSRVSVSPKGKVTRSFSVPGTGMSYRENLGTIERKGAAERVPAAVSPKSIGVCKLLVTLLGFIGAHYYYAGRVGHGLLYTLTLGLVGVGWLVDIVRVFGGRFTDKDGAVIER